MTKSEWSLRPATPDDRDFLFELNRLSMGSYIDATWGWDEAEQVEYFNAHFDASTRSIIVIEGQAAGELAVDERPNEIYVARIALLPEFQGKGIGTSVVRSILDGAAATERCVTLDVLQANPRAVALYEPLGFARTGEDETKVSMRAEPRSRLPTCWPSSQAGSP